MATATAVGACAPSSCRVRTARESALAENAAEPQGQENSTTADREEAACCSERQEGASPQTSFASRLLASFRKSIFGAGRSRSRTSPGLQGRGRASSAAAAFQEEAFEFPRPAVEAIPKRNAASTGPFSPAAAGPAKQQREDSRAGDEGRGGASTCRAFVGEGLFSLQEGEPLTGGLSGESLSFAGDGALASPLEGGAALQGLVEFPICSSWGSEETAYYKGTPPPCRSSPQTSALLLAHSPAAPCGGGDLWSLKRNGLCSRRSVSETAPFADRVLETPAAASAGAEPPRFLSAPSQEGSLSGRRKAARVCSSATPFSSIRRQSLSFPLSSSGRFSQAKVEEDAAFAAATVAAEASASLWSSPVAPLPVDENTPLFCGQTFVPPPPFKRPGNPAAVNSLAPLWQTPSGDCWRMRRFAREGREEALSGRSRGVAVVGHTKSSSCLGEASRSHAAEAGSQLRRLVRRRLSAFPPLQSYQRISPLPETDLPSSAAANSFSVKNWRAPNVRCVGSCPSLPPPAPPSSTEGKGDSREGPGLASVSSSSLPGVALLQRLLGLQTQASSAREAEATESERKRKRKSFIQSPGGSPPPCPAAVSAQTEEASLFVTPVASPLNQEPHSAERVALGEFPQTAEKGHDVCRQDVGASSVVLDAEGQCCSDEVMPCVFSAEDAVDALSETQFLTRSASVLPPLPRKAETAASLGFSPRRKSVPLCFALDSQPPSLLAAPLVNARLQESPKKSSPTRAALPLTEKKSISPTKAGGKKEEASSPLLPSPSNAGLAASPPRRLQLRLKTPSLLSVSAEEKSKPSRAAEASVQPGLEGSPQSASRKRRRETLSACAASLAEGGGESLPHGSQGPSGEGSASEERGPEDAAPLFLEGPAGKRRRRKSHGLSSLRGAVWRSCSSLSCPAWETALQGPALSAQETKLLREAQQRERERQERERLERERQEKERQEKERQEKERQEKERQEKERQERERRERERREEQERKTAEEKNRLQQAAAAPSVVVSTDGVPSQKEDSGNASEATKTKPASSLFVFSGKPVASTSREGTVVDSKTPLAFTAAAPSAGSSNAQKEGKAENADLSRPSALEATSAALPRSGRPFLRIAKTPSAAAVQKEGVASSGVSQQQSPQGFLQLSSSPQQQQPGTSFGAAAPPVVGAGFAEPKNACVSAFASSLPPKFGEGAIPGFGSAALPSGATGEANVFAVAQRRPMRGRGRGWGGSRR